MKISRAQTQDLNGNSDMSEMIRTRRQITTVRRKKTQSKNPENNNNNSRTRINTIPEANCRTKNQVGNVKHLEFLGQFHPKQKCTKKCFTFFKIQKN